MVNTMIKSACFMVILGAILAPSLSAQQSVVASISAHSVALSWTASTSGGTYEVLRDKVTIASSVAGTAYTDTNVSPGTHTYTVRAESVDSNAVQVTIPGTPAGASATFIGAVPSGTFGADGKWIALSPAALPSYATVSVAGNVTYTWADGVTCWYQNPSFSFDVNLTDGNAHKLTLYAKDDDTTIRAETITFTDATSGAILGAQSLSNFHTGMYLSWNVSGHVKITITATAGANGVISGIYFN